MPKALDLKGQKFHRLTVLNKKGLSSNNKIQWECRCDCGKVLIVIGSNLKLGKIKSCGCLKNQMIKERSFIHGKSRTRIHNIWWSVIQRCTDKNSHAYNRYGGAGILLHEKWLDFKSFYEWSINHGYQEDLTLDRIDNKKGYNPENCRWISMKDQQRNRTNNRYITIDGVTKMLCEWGEETGIKPATIASRIKRGSPKERWLAPVPKRQ